MAAGIRMLCSNGIREALEELRSQIEGAIGHELQVVYSTSADLKKRILSGAEFDVTVLTGVAVDALIEAGALIPALRADLARVGVGVGFRKGAVRPDVSTPASLKQTLLNASSVSYAREGASRPTIDRLLAGLGITREVEARAHLTEAAEAPELVARGESELVMTLISEILPVENVELAGPVPAEFQDYVVFSAAASIRATRIGAAQALIAFMAGTGCSATYQAKGMAPL